VDLPDAIPAAGLDSLSLDGLPSLPGAAMPRQSAMPAMPPMTPVAPRSPAASVWDAPPQSSPQLGTQQFQLSTENLALAGLRELVASLSPGRSLDSQGDVARLITRLHDTVEATSRGYVALRKGYHRFVARLGLDQSRLLSAGRIALETSDDPSAIAAALLDFRDQGETTPKDLETGLEEIAVHQVAMLEGVLQGVDALLDELSPEAIERAAPGPRRGLQLTRNSHREWWETYSRRHAELSEEGQALSKLFGPEFASAYQTYRRRRR
jgi:predicted component of type VI protein secretion system